MFGGQVFVVANLGLIIGGIDDSLHMAADFHFSPLSIKCNQKP
jgi:hypothetical protein